MSYRFAKVCEDNALSEFSIVQTNSGSLGSVFSITHETIRTIYPKYYPKGAVDFFLSHHCIDNISKDIENGDVFVIQDSGLVVGTVTLNDKEINRLFVLPSHQGKGLGSALLDYSEDFLFKHNDSIFLHASLPSKRIYLYRGYREVSTHIIETDNGDFLCYDKMEKKRSSFENFR